MHIGLITLSIHKSMSLLANACGRHALGLFTSFVFLRKDRCCEGRSRGLIKRALFPLLLTVACPMAAGATLEDSVADLKTNSSEESSQIAVPAQSKTTDQKVADFALAEVRKVLEPNPETEVVELAIDPDYKGTNGVYLVNVVLDAHGRKLTLGVMVSVQHSAGKLRATMNYID